MLVKFFPTKVTAQVVRSTRYRMEILFDTTSTFECGAYAILNATNGVDYFYYDEPTKKCHLGDFITSHPIQHMDTAENELYIYKSKLIKRKR